VISNHDALSPTKMWDPGRTPGSSSSVASAIPHSDTAAGRNAADLDRSSNLLTIGEPQTRQKPRKVPEMIVERHQVLAFHPLEIAALDARAAAEGGTVLFAAHRAVAIAGRTHRAV
jgi:hypothetical protein